MLCCLALSFFGNPVLMYIDFLISAIYYTGLKTVPLTKISGIGMFLVSLICKQCFKIIYNSTNQFLVGR